MKTFNQSVRPPTDDTDAANKDYVDTFGGGGGGSLAVEDEGSEILPAASGIDFVGDGVTATASGTFARVEIPGLKVRDTGSSVSTGVECLDFHGSAVEATVSGSCVRVQVDGTGGGGSGTDEDAIHDNVAGEIAAVTEKTSPADADLLLIEDSEDSNNKKRVQIGNLPFDQNLAAAGGDYLQATVDSNHNAVVGNPVQLGTVTDSRGALALVSNQITGLKAGRTYFLQGHIRNQFDFVTTQWHDVTSDTAIGRSATTIDVGASNNTSSLTTPTAIITPTQDITVELRVISIGAGTADVVGQSFATAIEIGAVQAEVTGGLEFIDEITVDAETTAVTFGEGGDGKLGRALDGDIDGEYVIRGNAIMPAGGSTGLITVRPNGLASNVRSTRLAHSNGATALNGSHTTELMAGVPGSIGAGDAFGFDATLIAKTGTHRSFGASAWGANSSSSRQSWSGGSWHDSTTKLTSLDIFAANNLGVGTHIKLYRRTTNNLRADSADTYERTVTGAIDEGTASAVEYTLGHTVYGGSVLGMAVRIEEPVTAGTVTFRLKADGTTIQTAVLDTTNTQSLRPAPEPIGINKIGPDKNISVEVETSGYTNAAGTSSGFTVVAVLHNGALLTAAPGGGRQHIKTFRVENTAQTSITFDGLDGDADGVYVMEFRIVKASTMATLDLQPNGATTNQASKRSTIQSSTDVFTRLVIAQPSDFEIGRLTINARTGTIRAYHTDTGIHLDPPSTGSVFSRMYTGAWGDKTTNITSLVLVTNDSSAGIDVGSEFRLYKLTEGDGQVEVL